MKYKWKISTAPTGRYRSFEKRSWPHAVYDNGDIAGFISCQDDYSLSAVKSGKHDELTLYISDHSSGKLINKKLMRKFKTLDEAKKAFDIVLENHPEIIPIEKPPIGIMPKKIWIETRIEELHKAIERYFHSKFANEPIVGEWKKELKQLEEII
jgi:hypothetical protein